MLTRLALGAIHLYQRRLRTGGSLALVLVIGAFAIGLLLELLLVPLLFLVAVALPAPASALLGLLALIVAVAGAGALGLASIALSAPFTTCRYTPSCSNYALIAYARYGATWGTLLTIWRLARCAPWGGHGWDPVPDRDDGRPDPAGTPRQVPPDRAHRHGQLIAPTRVSRS